MALSIAELHDNGDVTVEMVTSDYYDVTDPDQCFPDEFVALVKYGETRYRISAELASRMAGNGEIDAIPAGWTFGYPHYYVGDGFILCPDCALKAVQEASYDPEQMASTLYVDQAPRQAGETCDNCYQHIPGCEPYCGACLKHDNLIYSDTGESVICRDCLADALVKTRAGELGPYDDPATLAGVNTFTVGHDTYRTR